MAQDPPRDETETDKPSGPMSGGNGPPDGFGRHSWLKLVSWRALLVGLAIVFVPIGGALLYSYETGLEETQDKARTLANRMAVRANTILANAEAALADTAFDARLGCTEELIQEFRLSTALNFEVRSMGYSTADFVILCHHWGMIDPPFRLPVEPTFMPRSGGPIRFLLPTETFPTPGNSMAMVLRLRDGNWTYLLMEPEVFVDPAELDDFAGEVRVDLAIAGEPFVTWGRTDIATDRSLGAVAPVGLYDSTVSVAVPRAVAIGRWRQQVIASIGVGLLVSVALFGLVIVTLRRRVEQVQRTAIAREIQAASQVQRSLLPPPPPPEFPIDAVNLPYGFVSGDFYDYHRRDDGLIAFTLGDVSGKGLDAALLMSKAVALFRHLGKTQPDPGAVLATMNNELCETASQGRFVTCVVGFLEEASGTIRLANAGHIPPILVGPARSPRQFQAEQPPLGILADLDYPCETVALDGAAFYVITDGLLECRDASGREVGMDGITELLARHAAGGPGGVPQRVVDEVQNRGWTTRDDLTVLAISTASGNAATGDGGEESHDPTTAG